MPYIDPLVLASTIENAKCSVAELSDKYIDAVNNGTDCDCVLAEMRMLIFTIKALECCSSQATCGLTIEETFRVMESTMINCAAPTCTASISSPTFPPTPLPLISSLINVEEDGSLVGAFGTLNFIGAGITSVSVASAPNSTANITINTDGIQKTWVAQAVGFISGSNLVEGRVYWVIDAGDGEGANGGFKAECSLPYYNTGAGFDTYPHTAGIMLRAISTSQFDPNAVYLARVPVSVGTSWFRLGASYTAGTRVVSYNQVFLCLNNIASAIEEPANDTVNWQYINRDDNTYYSTEVQGCIYDIGTNSLGYGVVKERWDKRGNKLSNVNNTTTANEFIKKCFRWGVDGIHSNVINFWDDSSRYPSANLRRSPSFDSHLINYSNVQSFFGNKIDTNLLPSDFSLSQRGTRFWNMFYDASAQFYGNTLDNAVISNMTSYTGSGPSSHKYGNNIIQNSVINNANLLSCINNEIKSSTVIGDIAFNNTNIQANSNVCLFNLNFSTLPNSYIINNLGSKNWTVTGTAASTLAASGPSSTQVVFGGGGTGNQSYAQVNDIVIFRSCAPDPTLVGLVKVVSAASGSAPYDSITIPGIFTAGSGAMTADLYHPSIQTSFQEFSRNKISGSVIRGLNKGTATSCYFTENEIENTFIENYSQHVPDVPNVFISGSFYSNPGGEFGRSNDSQRGFARNIIKNSIFANNQIGNLIGPSFFNNIIDNASIYLNKTVGFTGTFNDNTINGYRGKYPVNPNTNFYEYNYIKIFSNSFSDTSTFSFNNIQNNTFITGVTLEANVTVTGNDFIGNQYEWKITGEVTSLNAYMSGLFNVTFETGTGLQSARLEGDKAALSDVTFTTVSENKQISNFSAQGYGSNKLFDMFYVKNFRITPNSGTPFEYKKLYPQLFSGNNNAIRGITWTKYGTASTTIGANTYTTSQWTLTITTQSPHFFTPSFATASGGVQIPLALYTPTFTLLTTQTTNGTISSPNNNLYFTIGNITNVIDSYTFECRVNNLSYLGWYFIDISNTQVDSIGNIQSTDGITGSYNDTNDIYGFISLAEDVWFSDYGKTKGNTISTNNFAKFEKGSFDPIFRLSLDSALYPTPPTTPTGGSRNYQVYKDWATTSTSKLYDGSGGAGNRYIRLPYFFDSFSSTILLGHWDTSAFTIDKIYDMPNRVPVRFVTTPGCSVTFTVSPASAPVVDTIIDDGSGGFTLRSYMLASTGFKFFYDEVVLMKEGNYIKIISKIIHA